MKAVKIGIMSSKDVQKRVIDIAAGRYKPKPSEPKIWFNSIQSLAQVLSDNNIELLKLMAEKKPESIQELADYTGKKPSNLSRTLKSFESYGFVQLVKNKRSIKPIVKAFEFKIEHVIGLAV